MIEVLKAFEEGKDIEVFDNNRHVTVINPLFTAFNFDKYEYRIKPQPTYIPYTWGDRDLFRDKWIRLKTAQNEHRINFIGDYDVASCANWESPKTLIDLFNNYEFIDGTPFGKLS